MMKMTNSTLKMKKRTHPKHAPARLAAQKKQKQISNNWSEYRTMWTIIMFDMPVKTEADRKRYTTFRKAMMQLGFEMFQFSIYTKFSPNNELSEFLARAVQSILPPRGKISILTVTGMQFKKMLTFHGPAKQKKIKDPEQLMLF